MLKAASILFGFLFTVSVAWAAGKLLLRETGVRLRREEEHLLAFPLGAACLSGLVFLLAACRVARPGVFLAAGLGILLAGVWRRVYRPQGEPLPEFPLIWKRLFLVVFAAYGVLYLLHAMMPETSPDGSSYHLGTVARYLREHGFVRIPTNMYANLSMGAEMLFLFAFAFGRHSAAALVHCAYLLTLPLLMLAYGLRSGFPKAAAVAAVLTFASPVAGISGSTAYNDVALACTAFSVFYLLQVWDEERQTQLLAPAGLLAGFCYAIKYTGFVAVPYALGFVTWKLARQGRFRIRPVAICAACALLMIVPWMAKNAVLVANPFSPFLNRFFPNPYVTIWFEQIYGERMRNYDGVKSAMEIPLQAAVVGGALQGLLGPVFLLVPLGLLALRRRAGRQVCLAALVFGLPYAANIGTRFLLPALPFIALAMGLAVGQSRFVAPILLVCHALLCWPDVVKSYCDPYAWRIQRISTRAALRIRPEADYLNDNVYQFPFIRMISALVPPGKAVYSQSGLPTAYMDREVIVSYEGAFNNTITGILWTPVVEGYQPLKRFLFRFPAAEAGAVRVLYDGPGKNAQWSVTEWRAFRNGEEVRRRPEWRLRAHPNPWDVQMAFDNSPVTRWESAEGVRPGTFIEVEFSGVELLDGVALDSPRDQESLPWRVQLRGRDGRWNTVEAQLKEESLPVPIGLRRYATMELKARGIEYIAITPSDVVAGDFQERSGHWGVTLLGEERKLRLYRLD